MNIVYPDIEQYLNMLQPPADPLLRRLEAEAEAERIPIMVKTAMRFVRLLVQLHRPASMLEIGTAIGYSGIHLLQAAPDSKLVTLEIDAERADRAERNMAEAGLSERVRIVRGDAVDTIAALTDTFDFALIDAAKGAYERFLELALDKIRPGGLIVSDNVLFRGMVAADADAAGKRHASLIRKLQRYNRMLMEHPQLATSIVPIGDGVAVSIKR